MFVNYFQVSALSLFRRNYQTNYLVNFIIVYIEFCYKYFRTYGMEWQDNDLLIMVISKIMIICIINYFNKIHFNNYV